VGIRFGRVAPGASEPEWIYHKHINVDGIGGFAQIFRDRGVELCDLPQIKYPSGPSSLAILQSLPKFVRPKKRLKWVKLDGEPKPSTNTDAPTTVAWHIFNEEETTRMRRVCRKSGVTVNSFLVKHLTKAIRPFLEDQAAVVPWMLPVNVRGKVDLGRDTASGFRDSRVATCREPAWPRGDF